jgi:hypothetical protein
MPASKKTDDTFTLLLDGLIMFGTQSKATKHAGISDMTLYRYRLASENGEEFQEIEYKGLVQPLHLHIEDCIEMSVDEVESGLRANAIHGERRPYIFKGEYSYEDDEYAMSLTEKEFADALYLGLVWPDKKLRRKNEATGVWERIKIMEVIPPSVDARMAVLRAWSDRYADKRQLKFEGRLDVNQNVGVTVLGTPRLTPPAQQLEVITPEIADQVNEEISDAVFNEAEEDEPMPDLSPEKPFEIDINSPLDPEQQRIMARARSGNKLAHDLAARALNRPAPKAPAAPQPVRLPPRTGLLDNGEQDDTVPRNPPPGAFKVV